MPFKSRAQFKKFKQLVAEGKISKDVMAEWTAATPNLKALPYRLKPKKKGPKKDEGPAVEGPKKNPDIPPYQDDKAGGWTQGDQEGGAFQKAAGFLGGFLKVAYQSLAGSTQAGLERHNKELLERMKSRKPLYSLKTIKTLYPGAFKKMGFDLSMEANQQSGWSLGDYMPGTELRNNAETGQFQGKNYRTQGVQNENREMKQSLKTKAQTARGGKHYGGTISKGIAENSDD